MIKIIFIALLVLAPLTLLRQAFAGKGDYFVLVISSDSNTVASYQINKNTGEWIPCDSLKTDERPMGIAAAENLNCIYVSHNNSNTIRRFVINSDQGKLVSKEVVPTAKGPMGLGVSHDQKTLFCAGNESCELRSYEIEQTTGSIQEKASAPALGGPQNLAVHPNNRFVFVPAGLEDQVLVYHFDSATKGLELKSKAEATGRPTALMIDPSGKYLVVANQDSNNLWSYKINQETGELAPSSEMDCGECPEYLVYSADHVNVVCKTSEELHRFRFFEETRGPRRVVTCNMIPADVFKTELQLPSSILVTPDQKFLYVLQRSQLIGEEMDKIAVYSVSSSSELKKCGEFSIPGEGEKCMRLYEAK